VTEVNPTVLVLGIIAGTLWLAAAELSARVSQLRPFDWRILFWVLVTLNVLDLTTTRLALATGIAEEGNPLILMILRRGEWWFVAYKLLVGGIASFAISRLAVRSMSFRRIAFALMIALLFAALWNAALVAI
jgi:hypothetical protein